MARVRLFHWKADEAAPLIDALRDAGHAVDYPGAKVPMSMTAIAKSVPDAIVIDLTRMPSHGRAVGAAIRGTKATRHLPLIFVDGDPEKVKRVREQMPDAIYTTRAKAGAAVKKAKPLAQPVIPVRMMDSYGNRTVAQKLGVGENMRVAVLDAPAGYAKAVGPLPAGAALEEESAEPLPITLWFVRNADAYLRGLPGMRRLAARTRLWVIYPKQTAGIGDLTQKIVREAALEVGLVDYKICSVSATWTGMLFAVKK